MREEDENWEDVHNCLLSSQEEEGVGECKGYLVANR